LISVGPPRNHPTWESALQTFSPREVQARVRAGESAEAVAADTGWALDKVLRYAEPLLAERSFLAAQAQSVEVRRSGGPVTLYDSCEKVLGSSTLEAVAWDAHRREDGRWVVTATLNDSQAEWTYDHHGKNLHPLNETARTLMGAAPAPSDDEVDIAEALDLASEIAVVREAEQVRPHLVSVPSPAGDETTDNGTGEDEPLIQTGSNHPATSASTYEQETISLPRGEAVPETAPDAPDETPPAKPRRAPRAKKGRTSIPSWDEILFGASKTDD